MSQEYFMSPIQVNEKMEVLDGQHRLAACTELGLPVHYFVSKGGNLRTVQVLNSNSKDWKIEDYMESYIEQGIKDYQTYKEFYQSYGFNHKVCLMLLLNRDASNSDDLRDFAEGNFRIKSVAKAAETAEKINLCGQHYDGFKRRNFIFALMKCLKKPKFNFDEFLKKLSYQSRKMVDCSQVEQYLELIEEIYNFKRNKGEKLVLRTI
jgi:hypothetical protein